ncbi:beta-defensin 106A-like [Sorex fumeus]|uniref:beta-defensin 106A-like n=1 Tax=Sorex fumeus TaxID=62283 RepID=UPI0024ADF06B|nr:beta-defensin 106A-like [Sorex fumeus]
MRTLLLLLALLSWVAPGRSEFFDERCSRMKGRCEEHCQKSEELVGLCRRSLSCCLLLQPSFAPGVPESRCVIVDRESPTAL